MTEVRICLFGEIIELPREKAIKELWARGLDFSHVVSGLTREEFDEAMEEEERKYQAFLDEQKW